VVPAPKPSSFGVRRPPEDEELELEDELELDDELELEDEFELDEALELEEVELELEEELDACSPPPQAVKARTIIPKNARCNLCIWTPIII
jgi:hypothetical protein